MKRREEIKAARQAAKDKGEDFNEELSDWGEVESADDSDDGGVKKKKKKKKKQ